MDHTYMDLCSCYVNTVAFNLCTRIRGFQSCPVVESQPSVAAHHGFAAPMSGDQVLFTTSVDKFWMICLAGGN